MTRAVTAGLAALAIAAFAGSVQAANVCQWTGVDWACGDGNIVAAHISATIGPPMIIKPVRTVPSNEKPLLAGPRPQ